MSTTTTTATAATNTNTTIAAGTTAKDSKYVPRGPTSAELTFYAPPADNSTPFNYVESPPPGQPSHNYGENTQRVFLTDIRGNEHIFNLDKDSFQALQDVPSATTYSTFDSDASIRQIYYPEVESLLRQHLPDAHKIILFDHTIRRADPNSPRQPVNRVHVDQTPKAALARVHLHITDPAEAKALSEGRYRIVNVWRPLSTDEPVQSSPLAFASATSIDPADLVAIEHRYPDRTGETMGVQYNPRQRWYYWSGMTGTERLLLKCSDSRGLKDGDVAQWVPHTAFSDARTPEGARPRESIEVRALIFG